MTLGQTLGGDEAIDMRLRMVAEQIAARGVRDPRVLGAVAEVPRERFTGGASVTLSYEDGALAIGCGQTISQPYMVARMLELLELRGTERALEIGTGLGYQAAVLSRLVREVVTVERLPDLARRAAALLSEAGYGNVEVAVGDGSLGWPAGAPYDAVVVAAASPGVPPALVDQLADGGRLVVPVGPRGDQVLHRVRRVGDGYAEERFDRCVFVPLLGEQGFPE